MIEIRNSVAVELKGRITNLEDLLRHDFPVGLITNGNSYPDYCGLPTHFNFVMFSQDVGVENPDADIFLAACKKAGCESSELMHIEDSLDSDIAGANKIGTTSVWLNRNSKQNGSNIIPDYEIKSLEALKNK